MIVSFAERVSNHQLELNLNLIAGER